MKKRLWRMMINLLLFPVFPGLAIPDGDGDPPASEVVDPLEKIEVVVRDIAGKIEGLPETVKEEVDLRIKEISGDVKAYKEEM